MFSKSGNSIFQEISDKCIDCGKCEQECSFLARYASPGKIAREILQADKYFSTYAKQSFECSLCSYCTAVCPVGIDPCRMFTVLRSSAVKNSLMDLQKYNPILKYEALGRRFPFAGQTIPTGCETAFFPGCTLPGLFPEATIKTYEALQMNEPSMGLILNCCSKPSISLGLDDNIKSRLLILTGKIADAGVKKILTACPNCYQTLKSASPPFEVVSVYTYLKECKKMLINHEGLEITIHDPCVTRFESAIHDDVRELLKDCGIVAHDPRHSGRKTLCCGEGGATGFLDEKISGTWKMKRAEELKSTGVPAMSYCAGCVNHLSSEIKITHLLNLLFMKDAFAAPSKFPLNYISRIMLKLKRAPKS